MKLERSISVAPGGGVKVPERIVSSNLPSGLESMGSVTEIRNHLDAVLEEPSFDIEVVSDIAREAVQLPDQKCVHFAFVLPAVIEYFQKLGSVGKLRRFAASDEDVLNGNPFAARRFTAR